MLCIKLCNSVQSSPIACTCRYRVDACPSSSSLEQSCRFLQLSSTHLPGSIALLSFVGSVTVSQHPQIGTVEISFAAPYCQGRYGTTSLGAQATHTHITRPVPPGLRCRSVSSARPRAAIHYQLATLPAACSTQSPPALATLCPPQPCNIGFQASVRDWTSAVNPCYVPATEFPSHGLERHTTYIDRGLSDETAPVPIRIRSHLVLMDTSGFR